MLVSVFSFFLFIIIGVINVPAEKDFSGEYEVNKSDKTSSIEISSVKGDNVELVMRRNGEVLMELTALINERKEVDFYVDEGIYSGYIEITHVNSADGLVTMNSKFKRKGIDILLAFLLSACGAILAYMTSSVCLD